MEYFICSPGGEVVGCRGCWGSSSSLRWAGGSWGPRAAPGEDGGWCTPARQEAGGFFKPGKLDEQHLDIFRHQVHTTFNILTSSAVKYTACSAVFSQELITATVFTALQTKDAFWCFAGNYLHSLLHFTSYRITFTFLTASLLIPVHLREQVVLSELHNPLDAMSAKSFLY